MDPCHPPKLMTSPTKIMIGSEHWQQMHSHVSQEDPFEACGLIGGLEDISLEIFPATNIRKSPNRFQIDPREQLRIFKLLEAKSWDLLAIYHSHPHGPSTPSLIDISEAAYPDAANLIWAKQEANWGCKAFIITENRVQEIQIALGDSK